MLDKMNEPKEVYQKKDGTWWHVDENWIDEHGPFKTLEEAESNFASYITWLEGGKP